MKKPWFDQGSVARLDSDGCGDAGPEWLSGSRTITREEKTKHIPVIVMYFKGRKQTDMGLAPGRQGLHCQTGQFRGIATENSGARLSHG